MKEVLKFEEGIKYILDKYKDFIFPILRNNLEIFLHKKEKLDLIRLSELVIYILIECKNTEYERLLFKMLKKGHSYNSVNLINHDMKEEFCNCLHLNMQLMNNNMQTDNYLNLMLDYRYGDFVMDISEFVHFSETIYKQKYQYQHLYKKRKEIINPNNDINIMFKKINQSLNII